MMVYGFDLVCRVRPKQLPLSNTICELIQSSQDGFGDDWEIENFLALAMESPTIN